MQINIKRASQVDAARRDEIKQKAQAAILKIAPEWKQRNLIARSVELAETLATVGALTTDEQAELDAIKAVWNQVKAIRTASGQAEADGTRAADFNPQNYLLSQ